MKQARDRQSKVLGAQASRERGLTLMELLIAAAIFLIAIAALFWASFSQRTLNEHSRNLSWAVNDASRVIERMRQLNRGGACTRPSAISPGGGTTSWDTWLAGVGGGMSLPPGTNERIFVTCEDNGGAYCDADQMANASVEWHNSDGAAGLPDDDPIRVTVAVCWRHRTRVLGECTWDSAQLQAADSDGDGILESPAMLTTTITCRG